MKKVVLALASVVCVLMLVLTLASCGPSEQETEVFRVTKPSGAGYTVDGADTAGEGQDYEFTVKILEGYKKGLGFRVTVNGAAVFETAGKYVVKNVDADLVIAVEDVVADASGDTVTVRFPEDPVGFTVSGSATAVKGGKYEFTVKISEGYEAGDDFAVTVNGKAVTGTDGKYTVENVTENLVIVVSGVRRTEGGFTVMLPKNPVGYTVDGATTVAEGTKYEFTVSISAGYEAGTDFAVKVNGKNVVGTDGKYTVENVTENLVIEVTGVTKMAGVVTIRFPENPVGFTISGAETAEQNNRYEFTLTILPGYMAGEDFAVTANGVALTGTNGTYVIESITSNTVIEVTGVEESSLFATFVSEGFDDALENKTEGFAFDANTFTFKITLGKHYTQCEEQIEVYYTTDGSEEIRLTPDEEGMYSISNPRKNLTVIVKNVARNRYTVSFFRNAVEKYSIEVEAGSILAAEQIAAAKAAVVSDGEEFVAWRQDVTAAITEDTVFSAYTVKNPAYGEAIDGCPLEGGASIPLIEGEYSAAGGFEKIFSKTGAGSGLFAGINLAGYSEVRFAIRIDDSWLLFGSWADYVDVQGIWLDVVMTNLFTGKWQVTVTGPVNHNGDDPGVRASFTAEYEGSTLGEILGGWYNDAGTAAVGMTELRGIKAKPYGEVITEVPAEGFAPSTDRVAPADFSSVFYLLDPIGKQFADVDISLYSEIRFYLALTDGYTLINGWGAYAEHVNLGNNWVPVTLTNCGNGKWTVTIEAKLTGEAATDPAKYTYTVTGTTLRTVLASWFQNSLVNGAQVYLTEIRGIKKETPVVPPYGEVITEVPADNFAPVSDRLIPDGFEKVFFLLNPTGKKFADVDISAYSEIRFCLALTDGFVIINGWSAYLENINLGDAWAPVTLVNSGDGTWTVTVEAKLSGEAATVPDKYTYTASGTTLREVLDSWFAYTSDSNNAQVYLTEIRGVIGEKVTVTKPGSEDGFTVDGADSAVKGGTYGFTVRISSGYEAGTDFAVRVNGKVITGDNGKYTVENVTEDLVIEVVGVVEESKTVTVSFPRSQVGFVLFGDDTAEKRTAYTFTLRIFSDYEAGADFAVRVNGKVITGVDGRYTVENVTEDLVIEVTGVVKKVETVSVTFPENPVGFLVSGSTTAVKGDGYSFTVTISADYEAGKDFVVKVNGKVVSGTGGKYTVDHVTDALVIEVVGVVKIPGFVGIRFPENPVGFIVSGENTVTEGETYVFTVTVSAGYEAGKDFAVKVNGRTVTGKDGRYTVENVTETLIIEVTGVEEIRYWSVTLPTVAGVTVAAPESVRGGETLTFTVTISDGYEETADGMKVFVNGKEIKAVDGKYTVADVQADVVITVTGVAKIKVPAYGEVVAEVPADDFAESTDKTVPDGFEHIYYFLNPTGKKFAEVDISRYSEIRFYLSLTDGFAIINGWGAYAEHVNLGDDWVPVTLTNNGEGKWTVTVGAKLTGADVKDADKHTYTATGTMLSEVLGSWFAYTSDNNNAQVYLTEIRGIKMDIPAYGEVVAEIPAEDFAASTDKAAPAGFKNAFFLLDPIGKKFADINISRYSEIKFWFALTDGYTLINGWGAYAEHANLGTAWVPVTLTNNGSNSWTVTVEARLTGGSVTDTSKYTYTATGSTLRDVLGTWFVNSVANGARVYLTEIRGIKMDVKPVGEVIGGVLITGMTEDTTEEVPAGFEHVYKVDGTFDTDRKSTSDLSGYKTVTFAFRSNAYFLFDGWSIYMKESYIDWAFVTMTNNGDGTWTVTVNGDVFGNGAVNNPWTIIYTGNSIATILEAWYNGSDVYVTELRGVSA